MRWSEGPEVDSGFFSLDEIGPSNVLMLTFEAAKFRGATEGLAGSCERGDDGAMTLALDKLSTISI